MNVIGKLFLTSVFLIGSASFASGADDGFDKALTLYENGMYAQAMTAFQSLPGYGKDPMTDGYYALCAIIQRTEGYENTVAAYLQKYRSSSLCDDLRLETAFDLFDKRQYSEALDYFRTLDASSVVNDRRQEFIFKEGYCMYKTGDRISAMNHFEQVDRMSLGDYSAPAQYCAGYIEYNAMHFSKARGWFEKSVKDERLAPISNYYIVNCDYGDKNYRRVVEYGPEIYTDNGIPSDRKAHMARIISESYLVLGDKQKARQYYSQSDDGAPKTRADYFFAGSLMYATGDYTGCIENYAAMQDKSDSLGQIAWYQTALSNIELKNKVAALDAFKNACRTDFDKKMTEDAFFNYAKLAFDLNGDTEGFTLYREKYADSVRGEKIFSYMALACLQDRDYQGAIDNYDKLDVLDAQQRNNYVHANYLRGAELLDNGSYRNAIQCMKAVTYYTPKNDRVNQLARYALGEAYWRNAQYVDAEQQYTQLYNSSALFSLEEGELLPYNIAYSCYMQQNYAGAAQWFEKYVSNGTASHGKDALERLGDCRMVLKEYPQAQQSYEKVLEKYYDVNDIYPYFQCAMAKGLLKDVPGKISTLENVLKADPSAPMYPEAMCELGKEYVGVKNTDAALKVFDKVIADAPAGVYTCRALLEKGTLLRNAGQFEEAAVCYKTVVEQYGDYGCTDDALLALESVYQSQNTPGEYLAYLDKIGKSAIKTDDDRRNMLFNAAEQMFYSGNYQKALVDLGEFKQTFPDSDKIQKVDFYMAECLNYMGDKVAACDMYAVAMKGTDQTVCQDATKQFAVLNFSLENYATAYSAYMNLLDISKLPAVRSMAKMGAMRSAFKAKDYKNAADAAQSVIDDGFVDGSEVRQAHLVMAKSMIASSRREDAASHLEILAAQPTTAEGAEACYMLIQDSFDKADFDAVRQKAFDFAGSGTKHQYWLAKAFIVLGDTYAEQGNMKQAAATFKSILDGYAGAEEDIVSEVKMRLSKISE